ncbi:MAG TPA: hypothetical protein PKE69_10560 [Pyrinomonadaceae bacterium]|nr:hypothetical protein [Pyrinomonadaceae bacterium]
MNEIISLKIDNEEVLCAELTSRENLEVIAVCESGNIVLFDCETKKNKMFNKLSFNPYQLNLQIHCYQNYVAIVQKNGTCGMVINLADKDYQKILKRGDYCAQVSIFPIAFYSKENQTFLIHGTDWNRLDITCLESDELLTNRTIDYDSDSNYLDYFHSSITVSPDAIYFVSNGWIWHPCGQLTFYSIDDFLKKFELSHQNIYLADKFLSFDWDRPLCWINKTTLAIGFSRNTESYGETKFPNELLFVNILKNKIVNRIEFDGFAITDQGDVSGELFYDSEKAQLIGLNNKTGVHISDFQGNEVYKNSSFTSHKYSPKHKFFYKIGKKNQTVEFEKILI